MTTVANVFFPLMDEFNKFISQIWVSQWSDNNGALYHYYYAL
jgi:hypothetical protein